MTAALLSLLLLASAEPAAPATPAAPAAAPPAAPAEPYEDAVIVVNGHPVTRSYLALTVGAPLEELERRRSEARAAGAWTEAQEAQFRSARARLRREGVRTLVFGELLRSQAVEMEKHGFKVTERMIDDYWRDMLKRSGGPAELASRRGLSVAALRDLARDELMADQYRRYLASRLAKPTPEEVLQYYRANSGKFSRPESVRARAVCIRRFMAAEDGRRVERAGALARAREIRELARGNPAGFAELAARRSEDSASAANGGLLGDERRAFLVERSSLGPGEEALGKALFSLPAGEVSDVIETAASYYVVMVIERLPAGPLPLKEVEGYVVARCMDERVKATEEELFRQLYPKLMVTDESGRRIDADEFFGEAAAAGKPRKLRLDEDDEPPPARE